MLKTRDKKWFSRSEMYKNLKNNIFSLFQTKTENIEFYQNSSFDDPSYTLPGRVTSPYLADKPSKRIVIRTLSKAQRTNILDERQNRLKNYLSKTSGDNLANFRNH